MRLFEIRPGDVPGQKFSIWHLDLDHVVSMRDISGDDRGWIEQSNQQNFFVTRECFERMMRAWESR